MKVLHEHILKVSYGRSGVASAGIVILRMESIYEAIALGCMTYAWEKSYSVIF